LENIVMHNMLGIEMAFNALAETREKQLVGRWWAFVDRQRTRVAVRHWDLVMVVRGSMIRWHHCCLSRMIDDQWSLCEEEC
jgi:hypothetical protein